MNKVFSAYPYNKPDVQAIEVALKAGDKVSAGARAAPSWANEKLILKNLTTATLKLKDIVIVHLPACERVGPADAQDLALVPLQDFRLFQVIDATPSLKVQTFRAAGGQNFLHPLVIQPMAVWMPPTFSAANPPPTLQVFMEGDAECIDAASLGTATTLASSSWRYTAVRRSDVHGCLEIASPVLLSDRGWNFRSPEYPVFLMLQQLVSLGWQLIDEAVVPYTPGGAKRLLRLHAVQARNYFRCALDIDRLCSEGLRALPPGQSDAFYRCAWGLVNKADLVPGLPASAYLLMLKDVDPSVHSLALLAPVVEQGGPAALALEDADDAEPIGQALVLVAVGAPSIDDDDVPRNCLGGFGGVLEMLPIVLTIPPAPPSDDPAVLLLEPEPSDAVSSSSSSSDTDSDNQLIEDEPMDRLDGGGLVVYTVLIDDTTITHIHGMKLQDDLFISKSGLHDPYLRLGVHCPQRHGCHKVDGKAHSCHKWRNISERLTARYGRLEAIGFLGCWVELTHTFEGQRSHVKCRPSQQQIDEWLLAHGYIGLA
jgi:hypothetical protein